MSHDVYIVYGDAETYEEDYSFLSGVSFGLQDGALVMTVSFGFGPREERDLSEIVRTTLEPLLRRHRMTIVETTTLSTT